MSQILAPGDESWTAPFSLERELNTRTKKKNRADWESLSDLAHKGK